MEKPLTLTVNGERCELTVTPQATLAEVLRKNLGLTGAKIACDIGVCGACTVLLDGKAVKSCLILALQADGRDVLTIEGLEEEGRLHPLQESFMLNHGFQCGYCTPGMILAGKGLLDENPDPAAEEVREAISGHICRCGTYPRIVGSILSAVKMRREGKNAR